MRKALSSGNLYIENEYLRKGGSIRIYLQGRVQVGGKLQITYACSSAAAGDSMILLLLYTVIFVVKDVASRIASYSLAS